MRLTIKEDDLKIFLNLSLTQNQTKIYLALLKLGMESNAASLFQISGVSRQDVYRVLLELEKLGIVERVIAKPNRFRAVPLERLLKNYQDQLTQYISNTCNKPFNQT